MMSYYMRCEQASKISNVSMDSNSSSEHYFISDLLPAQLISFVVYWMQH